MAGIIQNKQKALFSLWSLNKNCRNVVVSREKKNSNNIDDSNKTNKNKNKTMIIAITVVVIIIINYA